MTDDRAVRLALEIGALHQERYALLDEVSELRATVERVEALLTATPAEKRDERGNYDGRVGGTEHRTTGGRAWCFQCAEWCYPKSYACPCCEPRIDPDDLRTALGTP